MNNTKQTQASKGYVDHIPVIWFEPQISTFDRQLIIFLHPLGGSKETTIPFLQDLANKGFVSLSFDAWQHGERGTESQEVILKRVFGNFRRNFWPILGQTTIDTLRIIDWAITSLNVIPSLFMGGLSMGGDIAIAAAGLDHRIKRVAAVIATPDWLRPGMEDVFQSGTILNPGTSDNYSQYFYDRLNPLTNLSSYNHAPEIYFLCGEKDSHVPPAGAFQFKSLLQKLNPQAADKILISLIPNLTHLDFMDNKLWWPKCLTWLSKNK